MRKSFLACIIVGCFVATLPMAAEDNWLTVYGKVNIAIDKVDEDNGDEQWEVNSYASRFGVKGKGPAGDGFEAFYRLEWQVDVADEAKEKNITSRNQIVGLRGGFGEVFLGRHDTPTKSLQKKIDLFGDLTGDIKNTFNAEKRANDIVQYSTPEISGFKGKVAFIPSETDTSERLADGTSIALEYSKGDLDLGFAFDTDVEAEGIDTTRLVAQYKIDTWRLGFMYQTTDFIDADGDGFMVSAKYILGDDSFKVQIIDSDSWKAGVSSKVKYSTQTSLGWDHKMGKKFTTYGYYTMGEEGATGNDDSVFGVGVVLKF